MRVASGLLGRYHRQLLVLLLPAVGQRLPVPVRWTSPSEQLIEDRPVAVRWPRRDRRGPRHTWATLRRSAQAVAAGQQSRSPSPRRLRVPPGPMRECRPLRRDRRRALPGLASRRGVRVPRRRELASLRGRRGGRTSLRATAAHLRRRARAVCGVSAGRRRAPARRQDAVSVHRGPDGVGSAHLSARMRGRGVQRSLHRRPRHGRRSRRRLQRHRRLNRRHIPGQRNCTAEK